MERILLSQDDKLLAAICSDLPKFEKNFKAVKDAYDALSLGELTKEVFAEIKSGNTQLVVDRYMKELNADLDQGSVKHSALRNMLLDASKEPIANYIKAVKEFVTTDTTPDKFGIHRDRLVFLEIIYIDLAQGRLVVAPETKEWLLERYCRIYVETANDHKIYSSMLKMQSALQEFRSALFELGLPMPTYDMVSGRGYMPDHHIREFFTCGEDKKVKMVPEVVKWAASYKAEQERVNNFRKR